MMAKDQTDIAQRLREGISYDDYDEIADAERAMDAGADEIERLRSVLKRIRRAVSNDAFKSDIDDIARRALGMKK